MKKSWIIAVLTAVILLTGGCAKQNAGVDSGKENTQNRSAYDQGLEIVSVLDEMKDSEMYLDLVGLGDNSEVLEIVELIRAGDYETPENVYKLSFSENSFNEIYAVSGMEEEELSDALKAYLDQKLLAGIVNQINSKYGVSYLAVSAVLSTGKSFVCSEINEDMIYIYTFENGFPVIITFSMGEDGAVSAAGSFILGEELKGASEEELTTLFQYLLSDFQIEKLTVD